MGMNNQAEKVIEKAFSSYIKKCIEHAQKDYFEKLNRDSFYYIPLDAVTFEMKINLYARPHELWQNQTVPILSQALETLHLSTKEKKVMYYKYYEDKTDKEIAQLLGSSRQAVSKIKSNVLMKIKRSMEL